MECINASLTLRDGTGSTLPGLHLGALYQVASCHIHPDGGAVICLAGHAFFGARVQGRLFWGYALERFRPIYRPKSELIETLLKSADEPVREDRMNPSFSLPRPAGKRLTSATHCRPEPLNCKALQRSPFGISKRLGQAHIPSRSAYLSNYVDPPFQGVSPSLLRAAT